MVPVDEQPEERVAMVHVGDTATSAVFNRDTRPRVLLGFRVICLEQRRWDMVARPFDVPHHPKVVGSPEVADPVIRHPEMGALVNARTPRVLTEDTTLGLLTLARNADGVLEVLESNRQHGVAVVTLWAFVPLFWVDLGE